MGAGAFLEPLAVVVLLFGGTWINRESDLPGSRKGGWFNRSSKTLSGDKDDVTSDNDGLLSSEGGRPLSPSLLRDQQDPWRKREVGLWRWKWEVTSPNTAVFRNSLLSRLLRKFPFLAECWYWALVYWVIVTSSISTHKFANLETSYKLDISTWTCLHRGHAQGRYS